MEGADLGDTAEARYYARKDIYRRAGIPVIIHQGWWFFHNCIAHPLIGILPSGATFKLHDWTSKKLLAKKDDE